MKAIKYIAPEVGSTWAKTGYLFENGIFICDFSFHNVPACISRRYDFHNPPETFSWGKGVIAPNSISDKPGAYKDYQTFQKKETVEKDFEKMKANSQSLNHWSESHHPSIKLTDI